ncbi:KTSC domain-containing protein [Adhaeribacter arboris]|uniref:KTSC domain-containing protein n=1 Tax=Adhaeribacter arboris TaxID=2072846 RepID=A0A2T2Y8Q9_9BACT|nr:KTSC domain-containing protein [Adhaeribacter arboris]
MERIFVSSSNLYTVGYNDGISILEIQFRNGSIYQYFNVPLSVYQALMNAGSHGQYFSYFIKDRYRYRRIR